MTFKKTLILAIALLTALFSTSLPVAAEDPPLPRNVTAAQNSEGADNVSSKSAPLNRATPEPGQTPPKQENASVAAPETPRTPPQAVTSVSAGDKDSRPTAYTAKKNQFLKCTDRNGIVFWLDEKSKVPPLMPAYYKYQDENGITFWVDDESKIPLEYRALKSENSKMSGAGRQHSIRISIRDGQIIVPVVFKNKGRKVKAKMILDTGTSVTTLYPGLASRLTLGKNKRVKTKKIGKASRRKEGSLITKVDYLGLDDKIIANAEVVVNPAQGNKGVDGLLGDSFLQFFNYTIDRENQLLKWR